MFLGIPVSPGIAIGMPLLYEPFVPGPWQKKVEKGRVEDELRRFEDGLAAAEKELEKICSGMKKNDPEKAKIFDAHKDMLCDAAIGEEIRQNISNSFSAQEAVYQVFGAYAKQVAQAPDPVIRERSADLLDVRIRLLRCMQGVPERDLSALEKPVILVAHDLLPSDTASLDPQKILAVLTEDGNTTSHSAIIARSYGIPAVLGIAGITGKVQPGNLVVVDATQGKILLDPDETLLQAYREKEARFNRRRELTRAWITAEPRMKDGERVHIELNIGRATPQELAQADSLDGVGLYRTEFLYMGRDTLPSEEEQTVAYSRVLQAFQGKPVTIRTLDVGGDKKLDCLELPAEENPFLGVRALRLCFEYPDLFMTQLRAMLRASIHGELWLMFPMVGGLSDLRRAKEFLQKAKEELDRSHIPYADNIKVGIMVEIPSIALMADKAARAADFASIGTNDLMQYTMAADRMNPKVGQYCRMYDPALFRLIRLAADAFRAEGKPVGVCGEMGGDPLASVVLLGLGIRRLSMGLSNAAQIKKNICAMDARRAAELAQSVCEMDTAEEAQVYLKRQLADFLPE
ncbi:Phosphoenolpyruvate-protein phosphotransferase [Caprobacter fermentans]|uniref:Phosphoenolpyruvate-protein phosphotransferase n=1 Tax=Caproicibacter fermentans TaxID=2576756 RepID=A0A6N8HYG6_9FIRM|nr:phosphoenolpyruvate--protein phosphotransferase [Caproicibacter fermentans]MVB10802.1 Phosphoenolpyruvate-protein phosphotransferase [Caproicibacter fermentans]